MKRGLAFAGWLVLGAVAALPLAVLVAWHWLAAGREARRAQRATARLPQRREPSP